MAIVLGKSEEAALSSKMRGPVSAPGPATTVKAQEDHALLLHSGEHSAQGEVAIAASDKTAVACNIVFCGNPGVGKSSLASCISGERFEARVCLGAGLTAELQWRESRSIPGVRFADTPGLADAELRERAAKAINQAMTEWANANMDLRIMFVCTMEGWRGRPDDLNTIKLAMQSITVKTASGVAGRDSYGLIINKCEFLDNPAFMQDGKTKDGQLKPSGKTIIDTMLATHGPMIPFPTSHVKFVPKLAELEGQHNAVVPLDDLRRWMILHSPSILVVRSQLIDVSSQEQQFEEVKQLHAEALERMSKMDEKQQQDLAKARRARDLIAPLQHRSSADAGSSMLKCCTYKFERRTGSDLRKGATPSLQCPRDFCYLCTDET